MTTASEGAVDIGTFRLDLKVIQCLLQEDRGVIGFLVPVGPGIPAGFLALAGFLVPVVGCCQCADPPGFITCRARLLNASGEKDSKNCWYLFLSQISILSTAATSTISFSRPACSFRF